MVTWYRRLCPNSSQRSRVRCNAKRIAWMKHKCKVRELGQPQAVAVNARLTARERNGQDGRRMAREMNRGDGGSETAGPVEQTTAVTIDRGLFRAALVAKSVVVVG